MTKLPKIKAKFAIVACLLTAALAMPAWGDTLIFRNGGRLSGTLTSANTYSITFTDRNGNAHHYSVRDVDSVQFGDAPDQSQGAPPAYEPPPNAGYNQPPNGGPDDRGNGNNPNYANQNGPDNQGNQNIQDNQNSQDNQGYDQDRMERVVLSAGTEIALRTNQRIDSHDVVQGQTFSAQVAEDIRGDDGSVAIPRGSDATLITHRLGTNGDITLDVDSITVAGRRYRVSTEDQKLQNHADGVGANKRTGQYVGGGAVLGAVIGAIAGGGKGAAIGAVAGAGAGAGTEIITQGKEVHVPAETVIRFRLDQPLHLHLWS
jgi:hypothetical protein